MKVTILRGSPGSGKSTWAVENCPGATICSADYYFTVNGAYKFSPAQLGSAHDACYKKFQEALAQNQDCVIDNTNTSVKEMTRYYADAIKAGATVEIVQIKCNPEIAFQRCVHGVPAAKVASMAHNIDSNPVPKDWICTQRIIWN